MSDSDSSSSSSDQQLSWYEVRRGLSRIRLNIENIMDGPLEKTFHLANQSYVICCSEIKNLKQISAPSGHLFVRFCLMPQNLHEEQDLETLPPCPSFVWIHEHIDDWDRGEFQLELDSGKWIMSYYLLEDKPTRFEIWMDFGTKTAGEKTIMDGLSQLFTEQIQWDIQFQFKGGETVGAHVVILSAGSPVFAAMFRTDMVEAQTRRVTIENIERNVFWQLLIYLYTGSCPKVEYDNMTQLLFEAADMYDVETLKCECVDILLARLTVDNAVDLLIWAHLRSIPNLFEASMEVIENNGPLLCFTPEWAELTSSFSDLCLAATKRIITKLTDSKESEMDSD